MLLLSANQINSLVSKPPLEPAEPKIQTTLAWQREVQTQNVARHPRMKHPSQPTWLRLFKSKGLKASYRPWWTATTASSRYPQGECQAIRHLYTLWELTPSRCDIQVVPALSHQFMMSMQWAQVQLNLEQAISESFANRPESCDGIVLVATSWTSRSGSSRTQAAGIG